MSAVGSWRWQFALLGMTAFGAFGGVVALIGWAVGHPPSWARDE